MLLRRHNDEGGSGNQPQKNVLGQPLAACCFEPRTGFYRDGRCHTGPEDLGSHTVCAEVTAEFLEFSRAVGNDLSTPRPEFSFQGLKPGDRWCLCAARWEQARKAGAAPGVVLEATNQAALRHTTLEALQAHAIEA
jgi:uncharacterized protein (DUF2237 family)